VWNLVWSAGALHHVLPAHRAAGRGLAHLEPHELVRDVEVHAAQVAQGLVAQLLHPLAVLLAALDEVALVGVEHDSGLGE
jgi:hypothetical protein